LGLGDGTFANRIDLPSGNSPSSLAAADFDGDSLLDLVVTNKAANSVTVTLDRSNIPVTTNPALSSYPASEYVDLGLKVQATPRLHPNDEVTLDLQFDIKSLTGQDVNGIPVLSSRNIQQSVRLKENQTNILAGIVQSNELRGISGLPGLATLGPAGYLAGLHTKQDSQTELIIAVTPRQLRLPAQPGLALYAGRGTSEPVAAAPPPAPVAAPGNPVFVAPSPGGPVIAPPADNSQPPPQPGQPQQGAPPPGGPGQIDSPQQPDSDRPN
jgi:general secretion pathway protein D